MTEFERLLLERSAGIVDLSDEAVSQLGQHYESLARWNRKLNLTTIRDLPEVVERHYCESLFVAIHLPANAASVVDIGSGPGFPGVPVAVARPEVTVSLVESNTRKCVFLRESTRQLSNVSVIECRSDSLHDTFDCLVSRAVRWPDVAAALRNVSMFAVLVGESDASAIVNSQNGFLCLEPVRLPWGESRYLVLGHVSRGT